jgi:solute carrier family 25 phosphate transporter 23/24/25/41
MSVPASDKEDWEPATRRRAGEVFKQLDKNGDGQLSRDELFEGLRLLRLPSGAEAVRDLVDSLDTDKDGNISIAEFEAFAVRQRSKLKTIFDELDTDHSGHLDLAEVRTSLQKVGMRYDDESLPKLMRRIDKNQDGRIDFYEWQEFFFLVPTATVEAIFQYWEDAKALDLVDGPIPPPTGPKTLWQSVSYLSSGGIAAMVSRTATAPLDRIRTIYQVQTTPPKIFGIAGKIFKESGVRGFWRGNGANLLKVAPEKAIKFWAYETAKHMFNPNESEITAHQRFMAGASAGIFTEIISYPLDVIKTRLAAAPHGTYTGIIDVVKKTVKSEGVIRPFYRGITPSLLSTAPHSGIDLGVYEVLKTLYIEKSGGKEPSIPILLSCSTVSSITGLIFCYPLHVAKTRLVMQGVGGAAPVYTGLIDVFKKTYAKESFWGLYRGIWPSVLKSVPSHGLTYVTYEILKKQFHLEKKHKEK